MELPKKTRLQHVSDFSIKQFFSRFPQSLHQFRPDHNDLNAPLNDYSVVFSKISQRVREAAKWRCQQCVIDLSDPPNRKFLHTHHKNGQKWDNSEGNLMVVCIRCHSEEPAHSHMRHSPSYKEFLAVKEGLSREVGEGSSLGSNKTRPFFNKSASELDELYEKNKEDLRVCLLIKSELKLRSSGAARELEKKVDARLKDLRGAS